MTQESTPQDQNPQESPGLLGQNELVLQQSTGLLSNDFDITDPQDRVVGRVESQGSALGRMFLGTRSLMLTDADGTPLLSIRDPHDLGLDRYELRSPDGEHLIAQLQRKLAFFRTNAWIDVGDQQMQLEGEVLNFDFRMVLGETVVATISRQWGGVGRGLLGHSRYGLSIHPEAPTRDRLAIIGGVVALDLIRAKQKDS